MKRTISFIAGTVVLAGFAYGVMAQEPDQPRTEKEAAVIASKANDDQVKISEKEAKELALETVKGTINEFELDEDDGNVYYEVEMKDEEKKEIDVLIDASSGNVLKEEDDSHDDDSEDELDDDSDDGLDDDDNDSDQDD